MKASLSLDRTLCDAARVGTEDTAQMEDSTQSPPRVALAFLSPSDGRFRLKTENPVTSRSSEQFSSLLSVRFKGHLLAFILYLMSGLVPKEKLMSQLLWILAHLKYRIRFTDHHKPSGRARKSQWQTWEVMPKYLHSVDVLCMGTLCRNHGGQVNSRAAERTRVVE